MSDPGQSDPGQSHPGRGLRLYNTLTRTKENFVALDDKNVRMYVCGPTVYDFAHIGNARPAIVFDVLFRLLRHLYGAEHVTYVRNITDVDDKINARALRDFGTEIEAGRLSLNDAIRRVTEKTANQYQKDVTALGCLEPTHQPRATEFVQARADGTTDMIGLIQDLIKRGHAYEASSEVLFDTASMQDYGQLSKRNLDEQQAGARVEVDAHKKNPGDFVLWKLSSPEEPGWDSPWGRGRPGWHIECSAMSDALLWDAVKHRLSPEALAHPHQFDIHGGGLDLIFPHHENEIAQSRCAHGTEVMARYWMHNGFLQVEGQKMSKSLGNFYSIHELLETETFGGRKWPGEVLRLAMLMTHYREPIDFSVRKLEEAETLISKWRRKVEGQKDGTLLSGFADALADDLDMATYIKLLNATGLPPADLFIAAKLLGIDLSPLEADFDVEDFVARRLAFIRDKNWKDADRIRDELLAQGIQLKDGKDPATGERVTTWEVKR